MATVGVKAVCSRCQVRYVDSSSFAQSRSWHLICHLAVLAHQSGLNIAAYAVQANPDAKYNIERLARIDIECSRE